MNSFIFSIAVVTALTTPLIAFSKILFSFIESLNLLIQSPKELLIFKNPFPNPESLLKICPKPETTFLIIDTPISNIEKSPLKADFSFFAASSLNLNLSVRFLIFSLKLAILLELNVKNTSLKASPTGFI